MNFKTLRAMSVFTSAISVSTRLRSEIIKSCVCLPENAFRIMTTADGMQPAFSGRHRNLYFISDLYRSLPTSHGNCRSPLYPCYVKKCVNILYETVCCCLCSALHLWSSNPLTSATMFFFFDFTTTCRGLYCIVALSEKL